MAQNTCYDVGCSYDASERTVSHGICGCHKRADRAAACRRPDTDRTATAEPEPGRDKSKRRGVQDAVPGIDR